MKRILLMIMFLVMFFIAGCGEKENEKTPEEPDVPTVENNIITRRVLSSSMEPTLKNGKIYRFIKVDAEELKVNDIVLYTDGKMEAASRIVDISESDNGLLFTLKGDANDIANIEKYTGNQILGRLYSGEEK